MGAWHIKGLVKTVGLRLAAANMRHIVRHGAGMRGKCAAGAVCALSSPCHAKVGGSRESAGAVDRIVCNRCITLSGDLHDMTAYQHIQVPPLARRSPSTPTDAERARPAHHSLHRGRRRGGGHHAR
jgi:hypothetical protein